MDFNHYFTNEEMESLLKNWAETYENIMALSTIGMSHEKRPIWLAAITNKATGADKDKPALWLDANIHATEISGTTVTMFAIHSLLSGYGQDPGVTRILDQSTIYIVPRINPDGAALSMAANPRYIRSGVR